MSRSGTLTGLISKETRGVNETEQTILHDMKRAERNAWKALAGYKFWMFGYWAAIWIHLNKLLPKSQPNPFRGLVEAAREVLKPPARCEICGGNTSKWIQDHGPDCPNIPY
jgi:hypothetical protein